ncbi:hypothetical protein [Clostridium perfringens]|uniref:hypothetical protein n=1 Tax=Clostridium perfringens TaxID=1502 RepID=UPI0024BC2EDD|nr:hypothetical protein [Clostridium perfringens]MDU1966394.1 hypothetical protein [Clostridium perfringens]
MKSGNLVLKRIEKSVKDMSKDEIKIRYLIWIEEVNRTVCFEGEEEEYLANVIINRMENYKMNFTEACIVIGYVRKLLKIEENYINGIDIEGIYIKHCLSDILIKLAENIAYYIENQEEVYAHIPATLNKIYRTLEDKSKEVILW